ncbi:MAG TPA: DUF1127 domain-containing protein [Candidatus Sulfotelmatobacter sp.]|nr:DUF1127 domain-containing protein [Candidatus Sulfotelmatobacter sp.]
MLAIIGQWPVAANPPMLRSAKAVESVMLCRAESEDGGVTLSVHTAARQATASPPAQPGLFLRLCLRLEQWVQRVNDRRLLAQMDDRMLKDIGISSADALKESAKPFWLK